MQDQARFDRIYDRLDAGFDMEPDERDDVIGNLETLEIRFMALRGFIIRCLINGWTDADLMDIEDWVRGQGILSPMDQGTLTVIQGLMNPTPTPAYVDVPAPALEGAGGTTINVATEIWHALGNQRIP